MMQLHAYVIVPFFFDKHPQPITTSSKPSENAAKVNQRRPEVFNWTVICILMSSDDTESAQILLVI